MKKRILQLALIAGLVAVAFLLRGRDRRPETAEETIASFFDAASEGNDRAYLALTTGPLRRSLDQLRRQQGAEAFRANLRATGDGLLGQAVQKRSQAASGAVGYQVDLVFADRQETQTFWLVEKSGGWAIESIETAQVHQPEIPYGTPVFSSPEEEPAGADEAESPP